MNTVYILHHALSRFCAWPILKTVGMVKMELSDAFIAMQSHFQHIELQRNEMKECNAKFRQINTKVNSIAQNRTLVACAHFCSPEMKRSQMIPTHRIDISPPNSQIITNFLFERCTMVIVIWIWWSILFPLLLFSSSSSSRWTALRINVEYYFRGFS